MEGAGLSHDASSFVAGRNHRVPQVPEFDRPARVHHCWVVDPPGCHGRFPGLLLGWRRDAEGWSGRVLVIVPGQHGPILLSTWSRATQLTPA